MPERIELQELISKVGYDSRLKYVTGLPALHALLRKDDDGKVRAELTRAWRHLTGMPRAGIAFVLAERARETGDIDRLRTLLEDEDIDVKAYVLDALCGSPESGKDLGPAMLQLAIQATQHPAAKVRAAACRAIQNQAAYKTPANAAVDPIRGLLSDPDDLVRLHAACAVGQLARRKLDVSTCLEPLLQDLGVQDPYVQKHIAWALWQMANSRHDIGAAVSGLIGMLKSSNDRTDIRRNAAGALLAFARQRSANCELVMKSFIRAIPSTDCPVARKLHDQLTTLSEKQRSA
jgi:hypothetical protein